MNGNRRSTHPELPVADGIGKGVTGKIETKKSRPEEGNPRLKAVSLPVS
jgi:hypothetical protein